MMAVAQSSIIEERGRFRRDASSYPGTGRGGLDLSPQTWLVIAFATAIPLAIATFWAAINENWLILGPTMAVMAVCDIGAVLWKRQGNQATD